MMTVLIVSGSERAAAHLRGMISWVDAGFRIIGETFGGNEGWEMFERLAPDIVIASTEPPCYGLVLAAKIRRTKMPAALILLSESKNFRDVRTALELSVNGYLIERSLTPAAMLETLTRCREHARSALRVSNILKREFLRKMIEENLVATHYEEVAHSFDYDRHYDFLFLLLQHDIPLGPAERTGPKANPLTDEFFEALPSYDGAFFVCSLYLSPAVCGALYKTMHHSSQRRQTEFIYQQASDICQAYKKSSGEPLSVVSVGPFTQIEELRERLDKRRPLLQLAYYGWRGKLINPVHPVAFVKRPYAFLDEAIEKLAAALEKRNAQDGKRYLNILFDYGESSLIPIEEVNYILAGLSLAFHKASSDPLAGVSAEGWRKRDAVTAFFSVRELHYWHIVRCDSLTALEGRPGRDLYSGKLQQILAYIQKRHADDISVNDVASYFSLSDDYFRHYLKKEIGQSFVEYLTHVRVERAKRLLESGECKISEIAQKVGFRSSQYFSMVFRRRVDMTPSRYAQRHRYEEAYDAERFGGYF